MLVSQALAVVCDSKAPSASRWYSLSLVIEWLDDQAYKSGGYITRWSAEVQEVRDFLRDGRFAGDYRLWELRRSLSELMESIYRVNEKPKRKRPSRIYLYHPCSPGTMLTLDQFRGQPATEAAI